GTVRAGPPAARLGGQLPAPPRAERRDAGGRIAGAGRRSPRLRRPRRHWRRTPGQCRTLEHDATVSHGFRRRVVERSTRRMNVAIVDYGTGNLHSLAKALQASGASVHIEQDLDAVARADAIVLPGVGAFGAA